MLLGIVLTLTASLAVLAIPVSVDFDIRIPNDPKHQIKLGWLFGLIQLDLAKQWQDDSKQSQTTTTNKTRSNSRNSRSLAKLFLQKRFRQRLIHYGCDLYKSIQTSNLRLSVVAGMDDPADTGMLGSVMGPIAGLLACVQTASISLEPDFNQASLAVESSGSVSFSPLIVALISLGFLLSPTLWVALRATKAH